MTDKQEPKNQPSDSSNAHAAKGSVDNVQQKEKKGRRKNTDARSEKNPPPKLTLLQRWKQSTSINDQILAGGAVAVVVVGIVSVGIEIVKLAYPHIDPTERAAIYVKRTDTACNSASNSFNVRITFVNSGKTRAIDVKSVAGVTFGVSDPSTIKIPSEETAITKGILPPGEAMLVDTGTQDFAFDKSLIDFCQVSRTKTTILNAKVWYKDIHSCQHWLYFKALFAPRSGLFSPITEDTDKEQCRGE